MSLRQIDPDLPPPRRQRPGDAAADLPSRETVTVEPGERVLIPTGFEIAVPFGYCGLVLPRSGLALHHGLTVANAPGLIDSGYRGEIKVVALNAGSEPVTIQRGERIAQLLVMAVPALEIELVDDLPDAVDDRGSAGFGSSGRS